MHVLKSPHAFLCHNKPMEKIELSTFKELKLTTYTKEAAATPSGTEVNGVLVSSKKHHPYVLWTADEVPFFFYDPKVGIYGAISLSKDETLKEYLFAKLHEIMVQYNLQAQDLYCYLGPSLTFSHVVVDRPTLLKIMDLGYRAAAKRTSGVDFFDVPIMNVLMLRKLGIPSEQIFIDAHDTYECDLLLYSSLRGDGKKNPTVIELE